MGYKQKQRLIMEELKPLLEEYNQLQDWWKEEKKRKEVQENERKQNQRLINKA